MKTRDRATLGERILIQRRRRHLSQRAVAKDYGVTLHLYRKWEWDKKKPPDVILGELEPHEVFFLRRRRSGCSLTSFAEALGVSPWWLCQMEYGDAKIDRLAAYWRLDAKPWRPVQG